ncbi:MAG: sigma-54-dependent Fis family transcriptional regulator [Gemmatimonadota bacterium]|nr:sigma-54-dependent Fis family transcriptional regulator [Gemmatimonadota bacterium]
MRKPRVVVCDDEMLIRLWLSEHLADAGLQTEEVADGASLLAALQREPADLVLLDLRLPDGSGLDFLARAKALDPALPVIMMTAYGEIETAVAAVRAGAHHFLEKPIALAELLLLIQQALDARQLRADADRYRDGCRWQFADVTLVGRSAAMRRIAELITRVAAKGSAVNVLVRGESGTGKGVVARAIHARGPRHAQPFMSVNCASLPDNLVESELFGHEAGAYTDARELKRGLVEIAHNGTIFLDEIGDLAKPLQAKLLHFLETHEFRRVGGVRNLEVDVHVVTATNRDLEEAVAKGDFREDLFYRLNVLPVTIPPLRERPEDVAPLATHFVETMCRELGQATREIAPDALEALEEYGWPGNVREMENVLERVLLLEDEPVIRRAHLPAEFHGPAVAREKAFVLPAGGFDLEQIERAFISQALDRTNGNKTQAARLLGLSRDTLRYRLEKYGI